MPTINRRISVERNHATRGRPWVTYLCMRSANLRRCSIVRTLQHRVRFWIRARYSDNDPLCSRGVSINIHVTVIPMKIDSGIGPLVLGLESATDLQTLDQTSPTFQYIRSAFDFLLFGSMMFCLPVCLLSQQKHQRESVNYHMRCLFRRPRGSALRVQTRSLFHVERAWPSYS